MKLKKIRNILLFGVLMVIISGCDLLLPEITVDRAEDFVKEGKIDKAIEIYDELLDEDDENYEAWLGKVEAYIEDKEYKKAGRILEDMGDILEDHYEKDYDDKDFIDAMEDYLDLAEDLKEEDVEVELIEVVEKEEPELITEVADEPVFESVVYEIPFQVDSILVEDYAGHMELQERDENGYYFYFTGDVTLSGEFTHYQIHSELSDEWETGVIFTPDSSSMNDIPWATSDERSINFEISNYEQIRDEFGPAGSTGYATIVVNEYNYDLTPSGIGNWATLTNVDSMDLEVIGRTVPQYDLSLEIMDMDPGLEQGIRLTLEKIGMPAGEILTVGDLQNLTYLYISYESEWLDWMDEYNYVMVDEKVANIDGLQYAIYLELFRCEFSLITDLDPLKDLPFLNTLSLFDCQIDSLEALAEMRTLEILLVSRNNLVDIEPLRYLPQLKRVNIGGNAISDLGPLVDKYQIYYLGIIDCRVTDIWVVGMMENLETFSAHGNAIGDISPLQGCEFLMTLSIDQRTIEDTEVNAQTLEFLNNIDCEIDYDSGNS